MGEEGWECPPLVSALEDSGLEEIGVYITRRHNMVAQYIAMRLILDLCERSVWRPGSWVSWW